MTMRAWQTPIALVLAGLWAAALAFGHGSDAGLLDRFEATLTDLRVLARGVKAPPDLVTIVAIDDAAVREQGYPLPRAKLAELVDQIARHRPKLVVVDMLLVDAGPPDGDALLADALGRTPSVIAAAALFDQSRQTVAAAQADSPLANLPTASRFLLPLQKFADQARTGIVNVTTDPSGSPRSTPMLFRTRDTVMLSLPLRAASAAARNDPKIAPNKFALAGTDVPTDIGHLLPLSFYGPHGTLRTLGAASVLNGQAAPADIEDRVVVIGVTVSGGGDFFPTPFDPMMPGVEVISTAITHLLAGDAPVRDATTRLLDAVVAIALAVLSVGLLAWRRNLVGLVAIFAVVGLWATCNAALYAHGIWMSAALPIAAAAPPVLLFGALQIWSGRQQAQAFTARSNLMRQFQAPGLRDWLLADPDFLLQPVQQRAAVIFIDLSRFTALSETHDAEAVRDVLKSFHALVDHAAAENGGVVTGFMGDGAMIVFGLPQAMPIDAANAAQCCVVLSRRTAEWLNELPREIARRIGFKIGAHFGEIVASRLGGDRHMHITATGDTVNVASRLMEVAARHAAPLCVSDDLLHAAGPDHAIKTTGTLDGPIATTLRGRVGSLDVCLWRSNDRVLDTRSSGLHALDVSSHS